MVGFLGLFKILNCSLVLLLVKTDCSPVKIEDFYAKYIFKVIANIFKCFERIEVNFLRWVVIQGRVVPIWILSLKLKEIPRNRIFLNFYSLYVWNKLDIEA